MALEERVIALHDQLANARAQDNQGLRERDEAFRSVLEELSQKMNQLTHQHSAANPTVCTACGHQHEAQPRAQADPGPAGAPVPGLANIPPAAAPGQANHPQGTGPNVSGPAVVYDLSNVKSVHEVIDLFEHDDPLGRLSLNWMEENGPKNWRVKLNIVRQRFDDIKVVYDGVNALARQRRRSVETAANLLDDLQRRDKLSFRQLRLLIRSKRVAAKERHKEAVSEVKEARIERDFGEMLSAECSP